VIGGFCIGECYCILHALGNKKEKLAVFNLADFRNSPNCQNKFYTKISSYTVYDNINVEKELGLQGSFLCQTITFSLYWYLWYSGSARIYVTVRQHHFIVIEAIDL